MQFSSLSRIIFVAAMVANAAGVAAQADAITHGGTTINMAFVNVGNAGNAADNTGYGAVGYNYRIGKYEVSAGQWAAVLAAAPGVGNAAYWGGSQPAAGISWYEAAKFCNWLTTGDVNKGVYDTATWAIMDHQTAGATYGTAYFIPTLNEWYKAAYYDPAKAGGAGYWDYPTGSDSAPTAVYEGTSPGTAVYVNWLAPTTPANVDNCGGLSPYGTMGQGGNVWEWNESSVSVYRGVRGGGINGDFNFLLASFRDSRIGTTESYSIGFRVASVPEPGNMLTTAMIAVIGLIYGWRKRK